MQRKVEHWFYSGLIHRDYSVPSQESAIDFPFSNIIEPTFPFLDGLINTALSFVTRVDRLAMVKLREPNGLIREVPVPALMLAHYMTLTSSDRPLILTMYPMSKEYDELKLHVSGFLVSLTVSSWTYPQGREPRGLTEMPEEFRSAVAEAIKEIQQNEAAGADPIGLSRN